MEIRKLLFVTQFEELNFDALESLLDLRQAALNHVVFLSVIEREKVALRRGSGYQKQEEIKLREKANIRFIDWAEKLFEQGLEVGVYIVVGSMVQQVVSAAEKESVDLVVVGRPKQTRLEQILTGSNLIEILQRSNAPVLVYNYSVQEITCAENPFIHPVLITDWSPSSIGAIGYLKELHGIIQEVDIVHVLSEKSLTGDSAMAIQKPRKEARKKLDAMCDELEAAGVKARPHVYVGETIPEIEKAMRECQASMLVAGTSARGTLKNRLLSSIPQTLAETSPLPVLLLPPAQD